MNIELNASTFNTDGLSFPCFDDIVCTVSNGASRRAKEVIFRSDFPGSKKMTIINPMKEMTKPVSWDDIYENSRDKKISPTIVQESQSSFINDPFKSINDKANRFRQPVPTKQRITLSGDLTKARSNDSYRLTKKTKKVSNTTRDESVMKNNHVWPQTEPIEVNWCRTVSPSRIKRLTDSSQISEVTSSTSATSRSEELNELSLKGKNISSNRCVSRSRTVGVTPSRSANVDKLDMRKSFPKEDAFRNNFEVNWPSTDGKILNRETINLRQIRDTPVKSSQRYDTPKRAVSTSRTVRRSSLVGVNFAHETTVAEQRPMRTNRRSSLDNNQQPTPLQIKPRLYMSVSSPRKTVNLKCSNQCLNDVAYSNKTLPKLEGNFCHSKEASKTLSVNSEPLDFSEFDTTDFSSSDDLNEGFSMPFKPVEPLYYTSSTNKVFFPAINDDAEEEAWSALFSPPIG